MKHYRIVLMFVGLLAALGMKAQSPLALTIEDFDIQAGETKTVYVAMQNAGYDVIAIEFKMQLPNGLSLKSKPTLTSERIGSFTDDFGDVVASGKTVNAAKNAAGYWIFSIFSMTDQAPFSGTEGNVIAMSIAADASMSVGETAIRLYDIELSTKSAPYYPGEYSNKVMVWKENITITMAHDKRTFSCAQPLDFTGTGLKAYIATSTLDGSPVETDKVVLTRVEKVPAKTGLFLVGTEGETYTVPYAPTVPDGSAIGTNLLKPVLTPQIVPQSEGDYTNYLYGEVEGVIAFHKSAGSGVVTAGKAFLHLPTASGARFVDIVFSDDATGIHEIGDGDTDGAVYDLQGRRVDSSILDSLSSVSKKGIYIVGGKKAVVNNRE